MHITELVVFLPKTNNFFIYRSTSPLSLVSSIQIVTDRRADTGNYIQTTVDTPRRRVPENLRVYLKRVKRGGNAPKEPLAR
jgi:hypothetical protein